MSGSPPNAKVFSRVTVTGVRTSVSPPLRDTKVLTSCSVECPSL
jgi:hypothetical protein